MGILDFLNGNGTMSKFKINEISDLLNKNCTMTRLYVNVEREKKIIKKIKRTCNISHNNDSDQAVSSRHGAVEISENS